MDVEIHIATSAYAKYTQEVCDLIYESALARVPVSPNEARSTWPKK